MPNEYLDASLRLVDVVSGTIISVLLLSNEYDAGFRSVSIIFDGVYADADADVVDADDDENADVVVVMVDAIPALPKSYGDDDDFVDSIDADVMAESCCLPMILLLFLSNGLIRSLEIFVYVLV